MLVSRYLGDVVVRDELWRDPLGLTIGCEVTQ